MSGDFDPVVEGFPGPPAAVRGEVLFTSPFSLSLERPADSLIRLELLLSASGFSRSDILAARAWAPLPEHVRIRRTWDEQFPEIDNRPVLGLVSSDDHDGEVTVDVIAVRGGERRGVFRSGPSGDVEVLAAMKNGVFVTTSLSGRNSATGDLQPDAAHQSEAAHAELARVLADLGTEARCVGHTLVWYQDHTIREIQNPAFLSLFPQLGDRPVRHSVVRGFDSGERIRIEAMGTAGSPRFSYSLPGIAHSGIQGPNSLPFAVRNGRFFFTAATYGKNPFSMDRVCLSLEDQISWTFANSRAVLESAGLSLADVVHAFLWVSDVEDISCITEAWRHLFAGIESLPAHRIVVSELPPEFRLQVELIAICPEVRLAPIALPVSDFKTAEES